jgi:hypothetical protein
VTKLKHKNEAIKSKFFVRANYNALANTNGDNPEHTYTHNKKITGQEKHLRKLTG